MSITLDLPNDLMREVKMYASETDQEVSEVVERLLRSALERRKQRMASRARPTRYRAAGDDDEDSAGGNTPAPDLNKDWDEGNS